MHLRLCSYHKTFQYFTLKCTLHGNKSSIKPHRVLIYRLRSLPNTSSRIANKHYKNAPHLEHPCYFLKAVASISFTFLWCSFSRITLHNAFIVRKLKIRKKKFVCGKHYQRPHRDSHSRSEST